MNISNGNLGKVPIPSASKRPAVTAGLLLLLSFSTQEGCRCRPARPPAARDGGAAIPTAWLGGAVTDRRDHPVPEARALAVPGPRDDRAAEGATPFESATDPSGRFRLDPLPPGGYRLLV